VPPHWLWSFSRIPLRRIPSVLSKIPAILMDIASIGAAVAAVATQATTILPDVVRLLTRGGRIALP